ncbi:MAG: diacylglycerol kinase family protein [Oscillospiraceae bacterium]|nr:diacylglycerol kinase family protein [Oscillospiraceae bacterium]
MNKTSKDILGKNLEKLQSLRKSFAFAFSGIAFCIRYERNMRIHIVMLLYVMFTAIVFYDLTRAEFLILILTCTSVISLEVVNTAIEVLTDKTCPERSALAKVAKDAAAGAVLLAALTAIIVGVVLFWDMEVFGRIVNYFATNILSSIALILSVVLSLMFIFTGKERRKRGKYRK